MQQTIAQPGAFNPQAIENHYGLDLACCMVSRQKPQTIRICTPDPEIAIAVVRRLRPVTPDLWVESDVLAEAVHTRLGVRVQLFTGSESDVALVAFARPHYPQPPLARSLVLLGHNAISYKGLIYPGAVPDTILAQLRWMRSHYRVDQRAGMYGPRFLVLWALSLAAGTRSSSAHFWLGQRALDSIYTTGVFWWTGYITILCGQRR